MIHFQAPYRLSHAERAFDCLLLSCLHVVRREDHVGMCNRNYYGLGKTSTSSSARRDSDLRVLAEKSGFKPKNTPRHNKSARHGLGFRDRA